MAHAIQKGNAMKRPAPVKTTFGDLIAVLTEEVAPFAKSERETNVIVAHILSDLLTTRRVAANPYRIMAL
jgi:hypothetical protein